MVKVLCIVQARLTSSRLPDKVVMPLGHQGKTIAEHVFERLSCSRHIDQVVFAIPTGERNDELESFLTEGISRVSVAVRIMFWNGSSAVFVSTSPR